MADSNSINREQAMSAKPIAVTPVSRQELPDGGVRLEVPMQPTRMQRWILRVPNTATRRFELDAFGVEVLKMCDGNKQVRHIVRTFAQRHKLNPHEAERAVLTFLQAMMRKGLVAMVVSKHS